MLRERRVGMLWERVGVEGGAGPRGMRLFERMVVPQSEMSFSHKVLSRFGSKGVLQGRPLCMGRGRSTVVSLQPGEATVSSWILLYFSSHFITNAFLLLTNMYTLAREFLPFLPAFFQGEYYGQSPVGLARPCCHYLSTYSMASASVMYETWGVNKL